MKVVCWKVELLFVLIAFDCYNLFVLNQLLYWLIGECQKTDRCLEILLLFVCSLKDAG